MEDERSAREVIQSWTAVDLVGQGIAGGAKSLSQIRPSLRPVQFLDGDAGRTFKRGPKPVASSGNQEGSIRELALFRLKALLDQIETGGRQLVPPVEQYNGWPLLEYLQHLRRLQGSRLKWSRMSYQEVGETRLH
jgi:hypothetical protein